MTKWSRKRRKLILLFLTLGIAFGALGGVVAHLSKSRFYRELPSDAAEVMCDDSINDIYHAVYIKARVRRGEFDEYVTRLGLTRIQPDQDPTSVADVDWAGAYPIEPPEWWKPSGYHIYEYWGKRDGWYMRAKFEKGYLYFCARQ